MYKSVTPEFDETKFNFSKVKSEEVLLETAILGVPVTFLINAGPISEYHMVICPNIRDNLPQILNQDTVKVAIEIMRQIKDRSIRITYNSPGGLSSVNHLHLQMNQIEKPLYVENIVCKFNNFKKSIQN
jgi:GDP-D-glucose phosphorylase